MIEGGAVALARGSFWHAHRVPRLLAPVQGDTARLHVRHLGMQSYFEWLIIPHKEILR